MAKALNANAARVLTDIPNIGVSIAADLESVGIQTPADVKRMDALATYEALRGLMGKRHDPCVLDTFMAAKKFMNGGPRQPWWDFTAVRKAMLEKQDRK
ncbi:MAG: helix-hairpin-helix domain-containing protein [Polaromonas sp.]